MYNKNISITGTNLGYEYFIDYNHPLATGNSGRVLLHRHIASVSRGRWLSSDEIVHHIDGNKLNNNVANLEVMSRSEHSNLHTANIKLPKYTCLTCGSIYSPIRENQKFCSSLCAKTNSIKNKEITKEVLDGLIPLHTWTSLGQMFGYSDVGIKKRAISLGCM